ncbi:MAG: hypothetical protein KQI78_14655 [Deltaproteobacteria bacterium]|nr:hypothetical protein [Deltaproteobacteria bacterium]
MKLTAQEFSSHLHEKFFICHEDSGAIDAELIEVAKLGDHFRDKEAQMASRAFSLVFRVPRQAVLPQRIYTVENDGMGSMDIFLVPIMPDQEGGRMEAVFNPGPF